ncbi:HNH endonuclease [Crossiella sp. NPDC003009]
MRIYPMGKRQLRLCKAHATEFFKRARRVECARTLAVYGDLARRVRQAEAHHAALRDVTVPYMVCTPQQLEDVCTLLAAAERLSVRYFEQFEAQAYRAFPSRRDRSRARGHQVRAAERGAYRLVVDVPWLRRLYRDLCLYCGARSAHLDHLWPLVHGGDDAAWNLSPACAACNLSKGSRSLGRWLPGRLDAVPAEHRARWVAWAQS